MTTTTRLDHGAYEFDDQQYSELQLEGGWSAQVPEEYERGRCNALRWRWSGAKAGPARAAVPELLTLPRLKGLALEFRLSDDRVVEQLPDLRNLRCLTRASRPLDLRAHRLTQLVIDDRPGLRLPDSGTLRYLTLHGFLGHDLDVLRDVPGLTEAKIEATQVLEVQRLALPDLVRLHVSGAQMDLREATLDLPRLEYLSVEQRGRAAPIVTFDASSLLTSPRLKQVRLRGAYEIVNVEEFVARRPDVRLLVRP